MVGSGGAGAKAAADGRCGTAGRRVTVAGTYCSGCCRRKHMLACSFTTRHYAVYSCCGLQVTMAVVMCTFAHVLHAVYKPWGDGTQT